MSNVYISGTSGADLLMKQVLDRLLKRYHTVYGSNLWSNPQETVTNIITADLAIFIFQKGWRHGITRDLLVELGIAAGAGVLTVIVGRPAKIAITGHPWIRQMGLGELLQFIDNNSDLSFVPQTQVNVQEEKERADRTAGFR